MMLIRTSQGLRLCLGNQHFEDAGLVTRSLVPVISWAGDTITLEMTRSSRTEHMGLTGYSKPSARDLFWRIPP